MDWVGVCREVPDGYTVLREGAASILQKGNDVFYNPAQVSSCHSQVHVRTVAAFQIALWAHEVRAWHLEGHVGLG